MLKTDFLSLSAREISTLTQSKGKPRLGVFVPDGSRRLVLALTDAKLDTEEFYRLCAALPAQYLQQSLKVFFHFGLPTLLSFRREPFMRCGWEKRLQIVVLAMVFRS